jgi:hypothetical protein
MPLGAAIFGVVLTFALLVTGGLATTAASLTIPEGVPTYALLHRQAGEYGGAVLIALYAWIAFTVPRQRILAGALGLGVVVQGLLGVMPLTSSFAPLAHSLLAQVLFAGTVALAVGASPSWSREPQLIQDYGWPSLRSLSITLPLFIAIQVALGAAFRHRLLGLMPHVIGAMLVSLFILIVGSFVLQQCKDHKTLSGAGRTMMVVTFVQVFFGLAVFTVRSCRSSLDSQYSRCVRCRSKRRERFWRSPRPMWSPERRYWRPALSSECTSGGTWSPSPRGFERAPSSQSNGPRPPSRSRGTKK